MNGKDTMTLMQGDQVPIGIRLEDDNGDPITDSAVSEVAVTLGEVTRKSTDEILPVTYDANEELWMFAVTEADSLGLTMGVHELSARVWFPNGISEGATIAAVYVLPSKGGA